MESLVVYIYTNEIKEAKTNLLLRFDMSGSGDIPCLKGRPFYLLERIYDIYIDR